MVLSSVAPTGSPTLWRIWAMDRMPSRRTSNSTSGGEIVVAALRSSCWPLGVTA
jgi:hypothetical protein